jgi:hypothetical protein
MGGGLELAQEYAVMGFGITWFLCNFFLVISYREKIISPF